MPSTGCSSGARSSSRPSATEALTASILALVEPGQEVIVIEPAYDSYAAAIALAGIVLLAIMEGYARFRIWRSRER